VTVAHNVVATAATSEPRTPASGRSSSLGDRLPGGRGSHDHDPRGLHRVSSWMAMAAAGQI
jgi:hypothetical protein